MRVIGHVSGATAAASFSDYLLVQGIPNEVEPDGGERYAIWVRSDDHLDAAAAHLDRFLREPGHRDFQGAARAAAEARASAAAETEARASRTFQRDDIWRESVPVFTWLLVVACVGVFFVTEMGRKTSMVTFFTITEYEYAGSFVQWEAGLPEIRRGEVWRLITPMLIHFGPIHILFNMLWLKDLGALIEQRIGRGFLAWFIVVVAAGSNFAQYAIGGAPNFGGMSGVVYGLLGYVWMKGRYDSASGLALHQSTVAMMLIWLVLCYTGLLGSIANTAHTVGLVAGAGWGYLSARRSRHFTG